MTYATLLKKIQSATTVEELKAAEQGVSPMMFNQTEWKLLSAAWQEKAKQLNAS